MKKIITFVLRFLFHIAGMDYDAWKKSTDSGVSKSVEESKNSEEEARKNADAAAAEVAKQGNKDDVFGADEYQ